MEVNEEHPLSPRVSELTVAASTKNWGDYGNNGRSTGSDVSFTVIPCDPKASWTVEEAKIVALDVRKEAQKLLIADALARKAPLPDGGHQSVENYETILGKFDIPPWKEKTQETPEEDNGSIENRGDPDPNSGSTVSDNP